MLTGRPLRYRGPEGKRGQIRTIPVSEWVKEVIDSWTLGAGMNAGPLFGYRPPGL